MDAAAAISAAKAEGFAPGAIVFLDQEEGGRLLPEQSAYLFSWIEAIRGSQYRPGVYCSGIPVADGASKITTAEQILSHEGNRPVALWVVQRRMPACSGLQSTQKISFERNSASARLAVREIAPHGICSPVCRTYATDNNCYAPGLPHSAQTFVDLNVSSSADPSGGR